ncbi:MAG TPA: hypothetical protein VE954_37475 [Oligoflexus sp.]|uniref:hypothetical protein n=1 Tax=Oligoflexus sp. TaxID=1971216 RepID=UPI002D6670B6|nr:hypothetical protein [Oligoflexus sp.]HYX38831.1 hypothetical protein [Oligoflexus sp.]
MRLKTTGSLVLATLSLLGGCADKDGGKRADEQTSKPLTVIPLAPDETPYIMMGAPFNSLAQDKLDGFEDEPKLGCVIADEMGTLGGMTSALETYSITNVTSQEDFFRQIDVGYKTKVAATINAVTAKGSNELKGMHSIKINKNYSYALITARKLWQAKQIKKASVNSEILTLLKRDKSLFFSLCGDEYLSGFKLVTEAHGILECRGETREEKAKIDATISSSVGALDSAGFENSFNTVIDQARKVANNKCTLYVWQRGGRGTISDKPESFGSSVANYVAGSSFDNAAITEVVTTPYKKSVITAEFWDLVQGVDFSFSVPRSVIKFWQSEIEVLTEKMQKSLDDIDNEKDPVKKEAMYREAQKLVDQVKVVQSNIDRCSTSPDVTASCRDSRAPGEPWPDDPIIED